MKKENTGHIVLVNGAVIDTAVASGVLAVNVKNPFGGSAYLTIVTATEVGAASLNLAITSAFPIGTAKTVVSSLFTAITAAGTNTYLIGISSAGAGDVVEAFGYPLPPDFVVTFTVSGTASSFVLTAVLDFC